MANINIALVTSTSDDFPGTFVQSHIDNLNGTVFFYDRGIPPTRLNSHITISNRLIFFKNRLKRVFNIKNKFSYREELLINSFKKNRIQIVYAEYSIVGASLVAVCKKLNIPLITSFLGYDISRKDMMKLLKSKSKDLFDYGSKMIVVSKHMIPRLENLGCPSEKILWTPYPPHDFNFNIEHVKSSNTFFMMGSFVDKKAPYYSILAFSEVLKKHPKAKLKIAGKGPLYETTLNLVKYLNIEKSVSFLNHLKPKETLEQFKKSFCFIQHSITSISGDMEGTPVAILEASASGLPIISTKHAGIPDVVINNETGFLIEEHDVKTMANRMIQLIENKKLAKKMGEKGRAFVYENFRLEKHINILNRLIQKEVYNNSLNKTQVKISF